MNTENQLPHDARLSALLRESRLTPALPPGFQESVWRRIERAQEPRESVSLAEWLDRAAAWFLHPGLALAGVAAMLVVGIFIGVLQASSLAHDQAKQRYLTAVSPLTSP